MRDGNGTPVEPGGDAEGVRGDDDDDDDDADDDDDDDDDDNGEAPPNCLVKHIRFGPKAPGYISQSGTQS